MADQKGVNLHEGHRAKMKERFLTYGMEQFEDHNVLEFILFFAIPRRDTNEIAHRLMNRFGSFNAVLDASPAELMKVEGVGEHAALLLKSYPAVARRYGDVAARRSKPFPSYAEMGQMLVDHYAGLNREQVYAVFFDLSLRRCGDCVLHEGDINSVGFSIRTLGEAILRNRCAYLVLAHNHPGGVPIASSEDLSVTERIAAFAADLGVVLVDHFIVAGCRYSSLQKDVYADLFKDAAK